MANGIYVAVSGAMAKLQQLDVVANNLANVNTPGYKQDDVTFREVLMSANLSQGNPDRAFVEVDSVTPRLQTGAMRGTGNSLDIAIQGDGFFRIETPNGERFTRDGRFRMDTNGKLRTIRGDFVLDRDSEPIQLPPGHVPVFDGGGGIWSGNEQVGQLGVVNMGGDGVLLKEQSGMYRFEGGEVIDSEKYEVLQGVIEESNANPVHMMVELIGVQRAYEAVQKAISMYREMDSRAVRLPR